MDQPADGPDTNPDAPWHGDQCWRVGIYIEVDVWAYDGEVSLIAERALGLPGSWDPPKPPVEVVGEFQGKPVKATIVRSRTLNIAPIPPTD